LRAGNRREVPRRRAILLDDLFKPAIEPRHCIGDPVAVAFVAPRVNFGALRHAFDLTRKLVEPIVHHREIVAEDVLVVAVTITIWSASVPHAFLR
jgi:hypothetical protein